jgi:hypothetical protein
MEKEELIVEKEYRIEVARFAHEVNRLYCALLGDTSQPAWEEAPEWQRYSALLGVKNVEDNPLTTPADSHESWLKQKVEEGWVFGLVKDPEAKTHPCIVPHDKLPPTQQAKDSLFIAAVNAGLEAFK